MKSSNQAAALPLVVAIPMLLLLLSPAAKAAISCSVVIRDISPCASYLKGSGGTPPAACCAGAKALASAASSTPDKRAACACLKNAAKSMNVNPALAKALPGNCGISLGFTVDPNIDCSTIS